MYPAIDRYDTPDSDFETPGADRTVVQRTLSVFYLRGRGDAAAGSVFPLAANTSLGKTLIGRSPDCHIVIDSPSISRHHAAIQVKNGTITIEDLDSANGTFVNGEKIGVKVVSAGAEIRFHDFAFALETGDRSPIKPPPPRDPPPPAEPPSTRSGHRLAGVLFAFSAGALAGAVLLTLV